MVAVSAAMWDVPPTPSGIVREAALENAYSQPQNQTNLPAESDKPSVNTLELPLPVLCDTLLFPVPSETRTAVMPAVDIFS